LRKLCTKIVAPLSCSGDDALLNLIFSEQNLGGLAETHIVVHSSNLDQYLLQGLRIGLACLAKEGSRAEECEKCKCWDSVHLSSEETLHT
jgi:hypothetical protein